MPQFAPNLDLSTLNGTNGFQISGEAADDFSGWSVASAGDVNGDHFADLIIGAAGADPNGTYSGASYVVFGKASDFAANIDLSTLDGTNGFQISGEAADDQSGRSVASAGDVNGDGFADLILGAYRADPNGASSGASYVVFGKASGFAANIDLSTLDGANGFQISGEAADDQSGRSVASAGDVNGDGFADLIVGAYRADPNGASSGASYVVFGKASGFAANINLSTLNGTNGFQISGEAAGDVSGVSVASAGDVNGDGFSDLLIGTFGASSGGSSYVVFGKASGFAANINLSTLDGTNGFQISGEAADDQSGYSVASAGDVNGDGFADLIIGALGADANGASSGASYLVFGKASGFAANIDLSTLDGTNGLQISGEAAGDQSGHSVASAGDINGDGFADLIIGAFGADPNGDFSGASYVVFGKASGFAANINLSTLNGTNGFQISGEAAADQSGVSVASAGDVNGDGFADLIVGAYRADPNGTDSGASYVVFGHATGTLNRSGTDGSDILSGGEWDDTFSGQGGNDWIRSGAGDDIINGGADNDTLEGGDGDDTINGGSGNDATKGGNGDDAVAGGSGNDAINGGAGADTLTGGSGTDTLIYAGSLAGVKVNIATNIVSGGDAQGDTISGFENIVGSDANDILTGSSMANTLIGGLGNDKLSGGGEADILSGDDGDDTLTGGTGNDTLIGGAGTDKLIGDAGLDVLTGNAGNDRFIFRSVTDSTPGANFDVINDFTVIPAGDATFADRIDLSAIDAKASVTGNDAFTYIGGSAFTAEGQIRAYQNGLDTIVEINTSGSTGAEMQILLRFFTVANLATADFVL